MQFFIRQSYSNYALYTIVSKYMVYLDIICTRSTLTFTEGRRFTSDFSSSTAILFSTVF